MVDNLCEVRCQHVGLEPHFGMFGGFRGRPSYASRLDLVPRNMLRSLDRTTRTPNGIHRCHEAWRVHLVDELPVLARVVRPRDGPWDQVLAALANLVDRAVFQYFVLQKQGPCRPVLCQQFPGVDKTGSTSLSVRLGCLRRHARKIPVPGHSCFSYRWPVDLCLEQTLVPYCISPSAYPLEF